MHLYLDHIIMRGVAYSVNILRHKNWGAAVLLGTLKVLLALVLVAQAALTLFEAVFALYADRVLGFGLREIGLAFALCGGVMA